MAGGVHRPVLAAAPEPCAGCGTSLAIDQRYCLCCATRRGAPRVDALLALPPVAPAAAPAAAAGVSWGAPWVDGRVQPIVPAVTALLAGLLIGVTTSAGTASSSPATGPYVVRLPAPAPAPAQTAPALPAFALMPPSVGPVAPPPAAVPSLVASVPVAPPLTPAPATSAPATATPASAPAPAKKESEAGKETPAGEPEAPKLKHVFLITLSDQAATRTYATDSPAAPYLAKTLTKRGVLLANHHAVTRGGLANTIAMLSGQGPTPETQAGCPTYADVTPRTLGDATSPGENGQELGAGCVYPPVAGTLPDQLRGTDRDWAAYVEGMAAGRPAAPATCRHPAPGAPDDTTAGRPNDPYATVRNPIAYFHSLADDPKACEERDKDLGTLEADLKAKGEKFPSFAYVAPSPLRSGTDTPYVAGQPAGGLPAADAFLEEWVPRIEKSKAYADGGLIVITTDQAPAPAGAATGVATSAAAATGTTGPTGAGGAESDSCCLVPAYPNVPAGQAGGGRVGLLLLSQDLKAPGSTVEDPTNHFDLLRSLEDGFGLDPLGYAARKEVTGLPLRKLLDSSSKDAETPADKDAGG